MLDEFDDSGSMEETFALDDSIAEWLEEFYYTLSKDTGGDMTRKQYDSLVLETGLRDWIKSDESGEYEEYLADLFQDKDDVLDFPTFLQSLGFLATLRYPIVSNFSEAMNLLLREHIFPIGQESCGLLENTNEIPRIADASAPPDARTKTKVVERPPSPPRQPIQTIQSMSPIHPPSIIPSIHTTQTTQPPTHLSPSAPSTLHSDGSTRPGAFVPPSSIPNYNHPPQPISLPSELAAVSLASEFPVWADSTTPPTKNLSSSTRWELRCIYSMYTKLSSSKSGKISGNTIASSNSSLAAWPVADLILKRKIAYHEPSMRLQGFIALVRDCGLLMKEDPSSISLQSQLGSSTSKSNGYFMRHVTMSSAASSPTSGASSTKLTVTELIEIFDRASSLKEKKKEENENESTYSSREGTKSSKRDLKNRKPSMSDTVTTSEVAWASSLWDALNQHVQHPSTEERINPKRRRNQDKNNRTKDALSLVGTSSGHNDGDTLDFERFIKALHYLSRRLYLSPEDIMSHVRSQNPQRDTVMQKNHETRKSDFSSSMSSSELRVNVEDMKTSEIDRRPNNRSNTCSTSALEKLLSTHILLRAARCEPSIPRLRQDVVLSQIDGTSGSSSGVHDHPIILDNFASELLSKGPVIRGLQALYNHYSAPSTARLFKKVDAKSRTSTTKTGTSATSLYRSNSIARPSSEAKGVKKYRASTDQGSDEVNVEEWFNAFCTLDSRGVGRLDDTHVQLLLHRVGRTVPSENITDWVNRIGTGPHGRKQVTLLEILAGWSSTASSCSGHGALIVDNRPKSRGAASSSPVSSQSGSRAGTPLFLHRDGRSTSPTGSTTSEMCRSSGIGGDGRRGRFIGVDVGDFLELVTDFGICPDLLPISACRAIFTRRIASSMDPRTVNQMMTYPTNATPRRSSPLVSESSYSRHALDTVRRAGMAAISANCETFVALLCDVAHVGFGTYPYDASVSTFGEKFLVLLWRMQQCQAGIRYIGLRTNTLTGGETVLFGTLPDTAPTSVDEIRRKRREKRPDLALQILGHKMGEALPHERALWAKVSSPRSPGLGPKASKLRGRGKKAPPIDARRPSTFGTSPRKSDYEERVKKRRQRQQMSLSTEWDGRPKR